MYTNVRVRKPICSRFAVVGLSVLALVLLAGTLHPLPAQSSTAGAAAPAENASADKAAAKEQAAQAAAPAQPAGTEGFTFGAYQGHSSFEVGYRFSSGIDGNDQMYRSQVNLFEGARLLNSYVSLRSAPGTGLFDRLDLSVSNWGDPYNTARINISRSDLYDFRASYRNLNYYNFISNFANPQLDRVGNTFAQHKLNVDNRMSNIELRLFPNRRIVPFVGFSRNTSAGPGFTTVESTGNEFLLHTRWDYASNEFHGGLQFNFSTLNITVEQGYRTLRNHTTVTDADQPQGNEGTRPFMGQVISLDSLSRAYFGKTKLPTTKILAKFSPFQNLRMTGRYLYTMGDVESALGESRSGNLISLEDFLVYGSANDSFSGRAKKPNHNGAFLIEYSPFSRLTLTDSVDTLDYHISGAGLLSTFFVNATSLFGPGTPGNAFSQSQLDTEFIYNEVRNQAELEYDLGGGFAVRGGHRYTYVDVHNNDSDDIADTNHSRRAALVGLVYRPGRWLRLDLDYEKTKTNAPITRTDLFNWDQFNFDWRVGSWKGLSFNGRVSVQRNSDPAIDTAFKAHNKNYTAGLSYEPSERFNISVDYSRSKLLSDFSIVLPQNLLTARSIFDERVSGFGGRMAVGIYRSSKLELGYRGVINRGTAPIEFHQPYASLWIPFGANFALKPTWQYFGYTDKLFGFETYKSHLVTFSLVFTR